MHDHPSPTRRSRRGRGLLALLSAAATLHAAPASAQSEAHLRQLAARYRGELAAIAQEAPAVVGVAVVDLVSG